MCISTIYLIAYSSPCMPQFIFKYRIRFIISIGFFVFCFVLSRRFSIEFDCKRYRRRVSVWGFFFRSSYVTSAASCTESIFTSWSHDTYFVVVVVTDALWLLFVNEANRVIQLIHIYSNFTPSNRIIILFQWNFAIAHKFVCREINKIIIVCGWNDPIEYIFHLSRNYEYIY